MTKTYAKQTEIFVNKSGHFYTYLHVVFNRPKWVQRELFLSKVNNRDNNLVFRKLTGPPNPG